MAGNGERESGFGKSPSRPENQRFERFREEVQQDRAEHQKRKSFQAAAEKWRDEYRAFWHERCKQEERPSTYRQGQSEGFSQSEVPFNLPGAASQSPPRRRPTSAPDVRGARGVPKIKTRGAYLELLGFDTNAVPSMEEIRRAYRNMAMRWHPDRPHNRSVAVAATEMFQAAKDAHDYLAEENRRCVVGRGREVV